MLFSAADVASLALSDVTRALAEDVGSGDLTATLIDSAQMARAKVLAREAAVICGQAWVEAAVRALDPQARIHWQVAEGQRCSANQVVLELEGRAAALLTAERTALNFLQTLSAVASKTARFVTLVAGTGTQIVDTRKTLPGLRLAQKYAVHVGGGVNHRLGLYDAVLIKENHIAAAGGVVAVLRRVQETAPAAKFVQIEVETLDQLQQALDAGVRMVLLDNMDLPTLQAAVRLNASHPLGGAVLEISGGVNENTVLTLAQTGVHRISIGTLTKDVQAIDFSLRFQAL